MPLWTLDNPPTWFPTAELTKEGWINPHTKELLVAMQGDENQVGPGTGLQRKLYGDSRIQVRSNPTQAGHAAIRATTPQVQSGVSRLQTTTSASMNAQSRIQATIARIQHGITSVRNTTLRTQPGHTAVRVTQHQTMGGTSMVLHKIGLPNLLVEYGFYEGTDPLNIKDLTPHENDGILDVAGTYTNLGLRLDGASTITLPNAALVSGYNDLTIFAIVQPEHTLDDTVDQIVAWGTNGSLHSISITYSATTGLDVALGGPEWQGKYFPTKNVPFALVSRYDSLGMQIDTRISENSSQATCVGVYDYSSVGRATFLPSNGTLAVNFTGTLIYFAIFQGQISNGEMGHLFRFARNMLLVRGADPLLTDSFDGGAFQAGTFQ